MLYTNYDSNIKSVEESIISEAQSKDFVDIKRVPFSYKELREYQNILINSLFGIVYSLNGLIKIHCKQQANML